MNIRQEFLNPSKWSRPQRTIKPKGVVIHWVANPNSTAIANRNFFNNRSGSYGSAQYIVGLHGEVIQCLPDTEMAYHVGSSVYTERALQRLGSYPNNCTIGIECTHIDWTGVMNKATYDNTVELAVILLKRYNLTENDLWLHQTVVGWKDCHRFFVNNSAEWVKFKTLVGEKLRGKAQLNPEVDTKKIVLIEPDAEGLYEVKANDTYWSISMALDVTVADLRKLNPTVDENKLSIGQKIRVAKSNKVSHTIKSGDTLWGLARQYNTTVSKIKELNKNINPEALQIGAVLTIGTTGEAVTPPTQVKPVEVRLTPQPISTSKKYTLVKDVNGYTTAANAKSKINRVTTVKKGEYFVFNESQGMINVSTRENVAGSWINPSDNTTQTPSTSLKKEFKVNQKVRIKSTAKTYATGQSIPNSVKGKTYTIMQVNSDRVLLREIMSWVRKSDVV